MDWLSIFTIVGSVLGACYYMHRENRNEMKVNTDRLHDISATMYSEMKDFHGRLCMLEERYIQIMQKILEKQGETKW